MSNAFISGVIASHVFLTEFTTQSIKQKYGTIENVDAFVRREKQALRQEMLELGLDPIHLDLLFAIDDFQTRDEKDMLASITAYQGSAAGMAYRDCFLKQYQDIKSNPKRDYELRFDRVMMQTMQPYLTRFVDVDGIIAHLYFRLIELKNVAIKLKADHYHINAETRLRRL